ncbi:MAG: methionine--tRNA ligase [Clostridia bacterium]|nr:methionine--tRNA ligase [Clostridia bacterium]
MCKKNKFYITTAIAYTSSKPHIGNAYDIVLADMIARYKRMMGYDVYFMTGSDEHGQKIEEKAKDAGVTPKEFVDDISSQIKSVWDSLNTTYDKFIRTTDDYHEKVIQKIFKKLYEQDDIYKGTYEGKYCVPCESFFTNSQLVDGKCPDCGREVIDAKEEAYFLRLSKYQDRLVKYYEENPDFIQPQSRKNEMINNFIKPGLSDLCVSRSTFKWGIPVDFDNKHVVYVWIDALSNYITGVGYDPDGSSDTFNKLWPADLHVIGKDIIRFHTIYWPIILMALDLPLPKKVLGHPWVLVGEDKMSKSKGNVIYADELAEYFSSDAVRYYLLSEIPFAQDGTITYESFINKFNTDLANTIGNLVNRTIAMTNKYFDGKVSKSTTVSELDAQLLDTLKQSVEKYISSMDSYHNADACNAVIDIAKRCNKYIDETAPWILAKQEDTKDRLSQVLYNLLECIRIISVMFTPVIPNSTKTISQFLGTDNNNLNFGAVKDYTVGEAKPLFARLDTEKVLKDIAERQSQKINTQNSCDNIITTNQISIEDFAKIELRVAEIIDCESIPKAKKLLKLTLDDGSCNQRIVASGIAKWYTPEELIGKKIIVVSNLKPAILCGVESNGMILAADCDDNCVKVIFVDDIPKGAKIR